MKKCLLGLVMCTSLWSYSQSNSLGINAGFGHTQIKNYGDRQFKPHGNFGLSYVHSTKTSFGFGADLKYSYEGGEGENMVPNQRHITKLHYVRLPLKAIYFFGKYGQRLRPKIQAGPSLGLLVSAHDRVENMTNGTVISDQKTDDHYNNFDIGFHGGAGLNYRIVRNTWFSADVNYYNSFRDLRQQNVSNAPRHSNSNIALNIGVNWGIGK